jgi:sec-independent protein translocase protein TatC
MSIIEHLEALRRALIISLAAWGLTTIAAFFVSGQIVGLLVRRAGINQAVYLHPAGGVITDLVVAAYIGFIIAAPVVIQQVWWFVSPGLHKNERRLILPLIIATIVFFALGVALAPPHVTYLADISELIGFILTMVIGFGLVFELPVVIFVLGMLRIISSKWLYKNRPWWFIGLALIANFLTPGVDPLTPLIMFVPLYIFYEGSSLVLKLSGR